MNGGILSGNMGSLKMIMIPSGCFVRLNRPLVTSNTASPEIFNWGTLEIQSNLSVDCTSSHVVQNGICADGL